MSDSAKVRQNRLRRKAQRQALLLRKSRRRDPDAIDYRSYWLTDASTGGLVAGGEFGMTLDEVELYLTGKRPDVATMPDGAARPGRWYIPDQVDANRVSGTDRVCERLPLTSQCPLGGRWTARACPLRRCGGSRPSGCSALRGRSRFARRVCRSRPGRRVERPSSA